MSPKVKQAQQLLKLMSITEPESIIASATEQRNARQNCHVDADATAYVPIFSRRCLENQLPKSMVGRPKAESRIRKESMPDDLDTLGHRLRTKLPQELFDEIFNFTIAALEDEMLRKGTNYRSGGAISPQSLLLLPGGASAQMRLRIPVDISYRPPKLLQLTRQLRQEHAGTYYQHTFVFRNDQIAFQYLDSLSVESRSQLKLFLIPYENPPRLSWQQEHQRWDRIGAEMEKRYEGHFWIHGGKMAMVGWDQVCLASTRVCEISVPLTIDTGGKGLL